MKKILILLTISLILVTMSSCSNMGDNTQTNSDKSAELIQQALNHIPTTIKESPDKYTWYVRDYVGMNASALPVPDTYGDGKIYFSPSTTDGSVITDDNIDQYIVVYQNPAPNTEIKYKYDISDTGVEYSWIETQNIEKIDIKLARLPQSEQSNIQTQPEQSVAISVPELNHTPQQIIPSPDKYTWYVKDYIGRTLNNCGRAYNSGYLKDEYGNSSIKLVIMTNDGSNVDFSDENELNKYIVTYQSIAPNSQIKYTYYTTNGEESESLVKSQNIEEIELYVTKFKN